MYLAPSLRCDLILPDGKTLIRTTLNLNIDGIGVFKVHYIISKSMADEILPSAEELQIDQDMEIVVEE